MNSVRLDIGMRLNRFCWAMAVETAVDIGGGSKRVLLFLGSLPRELYVEGCDENRQGLPSCSHHSLIIACYNSHIHLNSHLPLAA